jgi:hypothetical protein
VFERFTDRARRVLVLAQEDARLFRHDFIGTEHILLGILHEGDGVGARALTTLGVSLTSARSMVEEIVGRGEEPARGSPPFTPRAKHALELSLRSALRLGHNYIGTEHILLGLMRESEGVAGQVLAGLGLEPAEVAEEVMAVLDSIPGRRNALDAVDGDDIEPQVPLGAASLLPSSDLSDLLAAAVASEPSTQRTEINGVVYETCAYTPEPLPEILVSVAGAEVSRAAFEAHTERLGVTPLEELGDAATYDADTHSLRLLVGTTLVVVQVRRHPDRERIALDVARRVLANLAGPQP